MFDRRTTFKALIIGVFMSVGFSVFVTRTERSNAANDDILTELANYKSWGRVTKEPFKVDPFINPGNVKLPGKDEIAIDAFRIEGVSS